MQMTMVLEIPFNNEYYISLIVRMDDPLSGPAISEFKEIIAELEDHEK